MLDLKGTFKITVYRNGDLIDEFESRNLVMIEGKNYLLKVGITGDMTKQNFYIGLIGANVTLTVNDTASSVLGTGGTYSEVIYYNETDRPQFQATFNNNAVSNTENPASFTFNSSVTVRGVFVTTTAGKNTNTGVLLCASMFTSAKSFSSSDIMNITYTLSSV